MLKLTNYNEHPTRPGFMVYNFYDKHRADYFETLLKENSIWHESSVVDEPRKEFLFGVRVSDHKEVLRLNYLVSAKYRRKTIPYSYLRLIIYAIAIGAIALAITGALRT